MFEREDWKLFRNLDTLCQKAGVAKTNIPRLIVKELVDNALDESDCEIGVLNGNGFYVRDYGNGMSPELIETLFSINRPMTSSKLWRLPSRGALGNGLRVVAGAVVSTNGRLIVDTMGFSYNVDIDDEGVAHAEEVGSCAIAAGTRIKVYLGEIFRVTESTLNWGNSAILMAKGSKCKCKTSPYWYTSEAFFELLNAYTGTLGEFLVSFDGMDESILDNLNDRDLGTREISFETSENILSLLREYSTNKNNHSLLGMIGDKGFNGGMGSYAKKTDTFFVKSAKGKFNAEIPYTVETWVRIQEHSAETIMVNKTPITGEYASWYKGGKLNIYRLGLNIELAIKPSQVVINVITPYMPITSDGKSPDFTEVNSAIQSCLNASRTKAKKAYKEEKGIKNEKEIMLNYMSDAIAKASGYGKYKFSQRQLYYAIRPYIMSIMEKQPDYNYFCRVLTEYENEYGDIDNLYRDPRGTLYHPHLGHEIPLGTIAVQNYERPEWTFNKILYCEKEGFFPILRDAKFPERFDCALLSSKGYASRAVKDLFDLLGDTDEDIMFFCIHDADSAGTLIYETLQEATLSRGARKVQVIDLGLNPWEALEMGLEVETFESKSKRPVASYIDSYDRGWHPEDESYVESYRDWLQTNRVELNAMSTPIFLRWLESKMAEYDTGKVIPYKDVMKEELKNNAESIAKNELIRKILAENGFDEQMKHLKAEIAENVEEMHDKIEGLVEDALTNDNTQSWRDAVQKMANKVVK